MKYQFAIGLAALAASLNVCAAPESYTIEPTHTFVNYEVRHFGTSTSRGRLGKISGSITVDREAKAGKVEINIDMNAIDTGVADLDTHLKKSDFFNVKSYPQVNFVGNQFRFDGDKVTQVSGDLTIMGSTNPVTLNATNFNCYISPGFKAQVCGGDFETTIERSKWNMNYGIPFVADQVALKIQVEAVKQ